MIKPTNTTYMPLRNKP